MTPYPKGGFYIAHRLFIGNSFKSGGEWGCILDGPIEDDDEAIGDILENFKSDTSPSRENLRVWHITPGKIAEDVTDWALWRCTKGEEQ